MAKFTILGKPIHKARPRKGRGGHFYTPQKTKDYESLVGWSYKQQYGKFYQQESLSIAIKFYMPIPKRTSKKNRALMIAGKIRPAKKPDIDNLAKAILDGLNGIAFSDDNQIVALTLSKYYGEVPKSEVEIKGVNKEEF